MTDSLELSDMISALRTQLEEAQKQGSDEKLRFGVTGVEIEASVTVTVEGEGKGGVRFWIIEASGGGSRGRSTTQHIKLNLSVPPETKIVDPEDAK